MKGKIAFFLFLIIFICPSLLYSKGIEVDNVSFLKINNYFRMVWDVSKKITNYRYKFIPEKKELILDFEDDIIFKRKFIFPDNNGFISKIGIDSIRGKTKVTIKTANVRKVLVFSIGGIDTITPKFIVTFFKGNSEQHDLNPKKYENKAKNTIFVSSPATTKTDGKRISSFSFHKPVVVIDPGHGGKDPGAIGRHGTKEKDIVFDVAKRVYKILRSQEKDVMIVYLTRYKDEFIPLDKRRIFAEEKNADLFISIHANASVTGKGKGIEIFYAGKPSDEEARRLAESENAADYVGIKGFDEVRNQKVREILIDMKKHKTIEESAKLAASVFSRFKKAKLTVRKIRQAEFVVLRSVVVPSILIEVGFISNWLEEKMLSKAWYREKLATYIAEGIIDYLVNERRELTDKLKKIKRKKYLTYVVKKGDTLSGIAQKYQIGVEELKKINKIKDANRLWAGRKIKVYVLK